MDEQQGLHTDGRILFKLTAVPWSIMQQGHPWQSSAASDGDCGAAKAVGMRVTAGGIQMQAAVMEVSPTANARCNFPGCARLEARHDEGRRAAPQLAPLPTIVQYEQNLDYYLSMFDTSGDTNVLGTVAEFYTSQAAAHAMELPIMHPKYSWVRRITYAVKHLMEDLCVSASSLRTPLSTDREAQARRTPEVAEKEDFH